MDVKYTLEIRSENLKASVTTDDFDVINDLVKTALQNNFNQIHPKGMESVAIEIMREIN